MKLIRLSGHSCAGKSRLLEALVQGGLPLRRAILYTSRPARSGEAHGRDYYFLSRSAIRALPPADFVIGAVRQDVQAADLRQLLEDLRRYEAVVIEIHPALWTALAERLKQETGPDLKISSAFITAIDPAELAKLGDDEARAVFIKESIMRWLIRRGKNDAADAARRAESAVEEILTAAGPSGAALYDRVFVSAPEGPDGQDEWTGPGGPAGMAKNLITDFIRWLEGIGG